MLSKLFRNLKQIIKLILRHLTYNKYLEFSQKIRANYHSARLVRIGLDEDGGYLVPDVLEGIEYCFSPGVADSTVFEEDIYKRFGVKSFLADASVEDPKLPEDIFNFEKKFLGSKNNDLYMTLDSWVNDKLPNHESDLILQMDIEVAEYEVLMSTSSECLRKFRIILIEFHILSDIYKSKKYKTYNVVFDKLLKDFAIVHIHPNNAVKSMKIKDLEYYPCMEFTFVRRDFLDKCKLDSPIEIPHPLDFANLPQKPDYVLHECWWKK